MDCIAIAYTFSFDSGGQTGFMCATFRFGVVGEDGVFCGDADAFASISMKIERDCFPRPKQNYLHYEFFITSSILPCISILHAIVATCYTY